MHRMTVDEIIATWLWPVSVQTTFLVKNFTKATKAAFYQHLHPVSSLSTKASVSVTSHYSSVTKAPKIKK